jgi:hypothetical protein
VKSLPIASLALVLALSGCASSPSVEEQTKLIEYEKCLDSNTSLLVPFIEEMALWPIRWEQYRDEMQKRYIEILEDCEKYRP